VNADQATTIINSAALLGIAIMQQLAAVRTRRNQKANHKAIAEIGEKTDNVVGAVNGPVIVALEALASAREEIAHKSNRDTDIMSAIAARESVNILKEQEALRLKTLVEKRDAIEKFKAEKFQEKIK
jgi:hypothetical protein